MGSQFMPAGFGGEDACAATEPAIVSYGWIVL